MTGGVFTRHEDGTFSVENGVANAIDMNGSLFSSLYTPNLTLAAEEGREIRFNTTRLPAGTKTPAAL